jgi:uncharacterized protein
MATTSMLWQRFETPGHDACRLTSHATGFALEGTGVFVHDGKAAHLDYRLDCDKAWRTRRGRVHGWIGSRAVDLRIARDRSGRWTLNGSRVSAVAGCEDLDLGFTPATNLSQIRRLSLRNGQAADADVAWLDVGSFSLELLHQRYERRSARTYFYESPAFRYSALLEVSPEGFVLDYPELWKAEVGRRARASKPQSPR